MGVQESLAIAAQNLGNAPKRARTSLPSGPEGHSALAPIRQFPELLSISRTYSVESCILAQHIGSIRVMPSTKAYFLLK